MGPYQILVRLYIQRFEHSYIIEKVKQLGNCCEYFRSFRRLVQEASTQSQIFHQYQTNAQIFGLTHHSKCQTDYLSFRLEILFFYLLLGIILVTSHLLKVNVDMVNIFICYSSCWCENYEEKLSEIIAGLLQSKYPASSPNKRKRPLKSSPLQHCTPSSEQVSYYTITEFTHFRANVAQHKK